MTLRFLGTGTSQGVPVVGCQCQICQSDDPKDHRLRSSILLETDLCTLLVDAGPDLRHQLLRAEIDHLDAVFLTHEHNDHCNGLDDLRPLIFRQKKAMPIYGESRVLGQIKNRFAYAFAKNPYPGAPRLELCELEIPGILDISDIKAEIFHVLHGKLPVAGIRIGDLAYITDAHTIPEESTRYLENLDVLIINCLRHEKHYSHMNLEEVLELVENFKPKMTYLTHISHQLSLHSELLADLPQHVRPAYDGLSLTF